MAYLGFERTEREREGKERQKERDRERDRKRERENEGMEILYIKFINRLIHSLKK